MATTTDKQAVNWPYDLAGDVLHELKTKSDEECELFWRAMDHLRYETLPMLKGMQASRTTDVGGTNNTACDR